MAVVSPDVLWYTVLMSTRSTISVWWVKRDARLADNTALHAAIATGLPVLPVFCVEPSITEATDYSAMHHHAQRQAVWHLRQQLRVMNADVCIGIGEAMEVLEQLRQKWNIRSVHSHEEIGNGLTFQRDIALANWCEKHAIGYHEYPQNSVQRSGVNRDKFQKLWQVRIADATPLDAPPEVPQPPELRAFAAATKFAPMSFPAHKTRWQPVSESDGWATLDSFLTHRGKWFRGGISSPNTAFEAGSRLSVHLAWGTLSTRQIVHALKARVDELDHDDAPDAGRWKQSLQAFQSRLHWRDHFAQRLESEPAMEYRGIHPSYENVPYENDPKLLAAWAEGRTGFPMVDAVMRCLATVGFVNFRMRAMTVSFACHALHLDWRFIHPHLAGVFRDYDPGIHLSQLQMQAGVVGWNPVRVYSPAKQLADWDEHCKFVKAWLPELRAFDALQIQNHTEEPLPGYPPPVVPFVERTRWMTGVLYGIRATAEAMAITPAVYQRHGSRRPQDSRRRTLAPSRRPKKPTSQLTMFDVRE